MKEVEIMEMWEERISKIKKSVWISFFVSFLFVVFAFILLWKLGDIISTLFLVVGYLGLLFGSLHVFRYFKVERKKQTFGDDLFYGLVYFFFGLIGILKSDVLANMLTYLLGAYLLYKSANRCQICFNLGNYSKKNFWNYLAIFSVIGLVLGLIIIFNPFQNKFSITNVIAYCVIISEVIHVLQGVAILVGSGKKNENESGKE